MFVVYVQLLFSKLRDCFLVNAITVRMVQCVCGKVSPHGIFLVQEASVFFFFSFLFFSFFRPCDPSGFLNMLRIGTYLIT
jgi:hypothetical protein